MIARYRIVSRIIVGRRDWYRIFFQFHIYKEIRLLHRPTWKEQKNPGYLKSIGLTVPHISATGACTQLTCQRLLT